MERPNIVLQLYVELGEQSFGERRNIVNEPCKKAVIAAPDIFEKAEHQN